MKHACRVALIATLIIIPAAVIAQGNDKAAIDKFISAHATREKGEEYAEARKVVTGDLDGDGGAETVVLYTIEGQGGSNNHTQYLVVFKRANGQLVHLTHTSVGSKTYRDASLDGITNRLINLTTMGYAKNDPACCPTVKGQAWYRLVRGALQPVRRAK